MHLRVATLFTALFICTSRGAENPTEHLDLSRLWDTERVLKNPGKGWYHHLLDNGTKNYPIQDDQVFQSFPGMDHLYLRLAWSYLEPAEGKYDWHLIDDVVEKYVPLGYGISFRITSKETGTYPGSVGQESNGVQYATPVWVRDAGAKGTVVDARGTKSWTPDWGDPVYLRKLENFQKAFAAKYDGKPWVRYVDVGSIGEWGEGHTSFSTKVPPTVEQVKANIDVYLRSFRKTQLVVTDDLLYYGKPEAAVRELYDYAVTNGVTLRDDSPLVSWYIQAHLKTWSISHPQFYDPLYLRKPIIFELEHYRSVKQNGDWLGMNGTNILAKHGYSGAEVMRNAIRTMRASYIGYHGLAESWLEDNPDLTGELANLCGYWYFPVRLVTPQFFRHGTNTVLIGWLNKGVAPAYEPFQIEFRMVDPKTHKGPNLGRAESGNLEWVPEKAMFKSYTLQVPKGVKAGDYMLQARLSVQRGNGRVAVEMGLKQELRAPDGFYAFAKMKVK